MEKIRKNNFGNRKILNLRNRSFVNVSCKERFLQVSDLRTVLGLGFANKIGGFLLVWGVLRGFRGCGNSQILNVLRVWELRKLELKIEFEES